MSFDELVAKEELIEVEEWQIDEYWDPEEVEWIDKDTIILHGRNEGRKFRVRRKPNVADELFDIDNLPVINDWQIREFWKQKDYRFLSPNVVQRTDGRKWRVRKDEKIVYVGQRYW